MVEKYIKRHSFLARFTHGTAAVCCILLIFSGIFVFVPAANAWAGPEFTIAMRWLHRLAAIPFILVPLYAFFFSLKGAKHLFCQNIFGKWDEDDYIFAKKFLPYLFAPGKVHMPPQREVKSMQRVADGTLLFAGIFAAISGLIMWLNTGLLPGGEWAIHFSQTTLFVAKTVHIVAFLVFIVFGLGHVYLGGGIFQPYRGTARLMFGDGKVSEADAAYHWGYWANVKIATGEDVSEEQKNDPDPVLIKEAQAGVKKAR